MDPISQATLGALAARAVTGNRFCGGARAPVLLVGAAAGAAPDIDVLFSIGGDFYDQLVTHRGITHSLFFAPVFGPLLGWLVWRWRRHRYGDDTQRAGALGGWMVACMVALWSHPLLDALTPYGTQLLLPFTDARFAVFAMPIIDPLYTLVLIAGVVLAARLQAARVAACAVLAISSAYLLWAWHLNVGAREFARADLEGRGIAPLQVEAFPTILQPFMRRVVGRTPERDYVGYLSMWDPCAIDWADGERAPGRLADAFEQRRDGRIFSWFAMGWTHYAVRDTDTGTELVAADLRYGTEPDPAVSVFSVALPLRADGDLTSTQAAGARYQPSVDRVDELLNTAYGACVAPSQAR